MKYLFNSKGKHIANESRGQLHSTSGKNFGHYLDNHKFFIDMNGRYLGELYDGNRLLHRLGNGYENVSFGNYGNYGNIGSFGNPGNIGNAGMPAGYKDIVEEKLK